MVPVDDGEVFPPEEAECLQEFLTEPMAFPNGANDAQIDAMSQALGFFAHLYKDNYHNPEHKNRSRVIYPRRWSSA